MKIISKIIVMLFFVLFIVPFVSAEAINATHAQGLISYSESGVTTPRYRLWNETTNNFTAEFTDTSDAGSNINWVIVRA
ncbi:hypothetical protein COV16_04720, partial [Candidatus Woesearchaeota archaeon CG10_big_fil_rev_8_21_14_0_10_34_8]